MNQHKTYKKIKHKQKQVKTDTQTKTKIQKTNGENKTYYNKKKRNGKQNENK